MRAVILLSGGLDSLVALALARETCTVTLALTVNYGQRAAERELRAARAIADHYGIPHLEIALPWLEALLPQALRADLAADLTASGQDPLALREIWVPNRNGLFLNLAAAYAEASQAGAVIFGANLEEGAEFPDNTPAFRQALEQSLAHSTLNRVRVLAPVEAMDKARIVGEGLRLNAPLHLVWSCYEGSEVHCGVCASCRRLWQALAKSAAAGQSVPPLEFLV